MEHRITGMRSKEGIRQRASRAEIAKYVSYTPFSEDKRHCDADSDREAAIMIS